jgi:hypothetical protein
MVNVGMKFFLLASALAWTKIDAGKNDKGWCWAEFGGGWCWLTWDGLEYHVKDNTVQGGCSAFTGADADYYCEKANDPGPTQAQSGSATTASGEGGLEGILATLAGKTEVDCDAVCKAVGKSYQGYGMSSSGDVMTTSCTCSGESVKVACVGTPFIECCENECEAGKCVDEPAGWECPKGGGCPSGMCTAKDWEGWVSAHNIYRCMHDVSPVVWSPPVFDDVYSYFKDMSSMHHSDCYGVPPPAGPAGENLYSASWAASPLEAVSAWYSEIADCGPFPGCESGATGTVGHFTAMIWDGDKEIGCVANSHNLAACRYKGANFASCQTPNYGGSASYVQNVFANVKSFSTCKAAVAACGLPVEDVASIDQTTGYNQNYPNGPGIKYEVEKNPRGESGSYSTVVGAGAAVSLMAAFVVLRRKKSADLSEEREALNMEDVE